MSSLITSSEPALLWTKSGDIPKLTHPNNDEWKDDLILILSAMRGYVILSSDDPEPQPLDFIHNDTSDDMMAKEAEAASTIGMSCYPEVRRIVKVMRNTLEMWNTLETSLDTAGSYIGRQHILCQFRACHPNEDEPLKAYFTNHSKYHTQLDHTDDAITDRNVRTQLFTSLASQYAMILMVLNHWRPLPKPEQAMHDLLEEETTTGAIKELGAASRGATLFSQSGVNCGRGCGGHGGHSARGGSGGRGDSYESKCTYCKIDSQTTAACRKRKHGQEEENNNERICFQCALPHHVKVDCIS